MASLIFFTSSVFPAFFKRTCITFSTLCFPFLSRKAVSNSPVGLPASPSRSGLNTLDCTWRRLPKHKRKEASSSDQTRTRIGIWLKSLLYGRDRMFQCALGLRRYTQQHSVAIGRNHVDSYVQSHWWPIFRQCLLEDPLQNKDTQSVTYK